MFHARRFTLIILLTTTSMLGLGAGSVFAADADPMQPYNVFVAEDQAYTRCGPSAEYYRTDPLKHGQQLEVYAETDDGWLGVRPPQDSFCWIPADTVELDGSGEMGNVIEDRTVAWIGTHLGRARKYLWQVQLAEGEPVTVIGRQERDGPDGPQLWLRIVPPSGEFRWIHQNQTVRTSEELVETLAEQNRSLAKSDVQFQPAGRTHVERTHVERTHVERTHVDKQPKPAKVASAVKPEPTASPRRLQADAAAVADSGRSVMIDSANSKAIGSGVQSFDNNTIDLPPSLDTSAGLIAKPRRSTASRPQPRGLLASMAKLGQPRIQEIGAEESLVDQVALADSKVAGDDNWVSGAASRMSKDSDSVAISAAPMTLPARETVSIPSEAFVQSHQSSNEIAQVAGISPLPAQTLVPAVPLTNNFNSSLAPATDSPLLRSPTFVSADQISRLQQQVRGADLNSMRLVLSQLMSSQSSAAEARVVSEASRSLAARSTDPTIADGARVLARRADQYAGLADRRDGPSVIQSSSQPISNTPGLQSLPMTDASIAGDGLGVAASLAPAPQPADSKASYTGQLVQVYSARTHSPPFALTDGTGRTIAYVTPSPGINLRMHLNQQVTVTGTPGFVSGLNMPHVMAQRADR
ncbi:hypothetical protein LF1_08540 [Rubripirellula obstinata]|uniref:Secreted protein n=1 Tax=Rubripirellula obstinata TaxID=406547 RepID=A0A5B1CB71_9BACT|nr:hypothetical protein [Rubripirellula obstinata]KAA1258337.1 hypothetical protein LF1_08540 [Rubripirellula obstinata]